MTGPPSASTPPGRGEEGFSALPAAALVTAVFACSIYANLSFAVTDRADYRYFPPFEPHVDANWNRALGGEYINVARSLAAGEGFAHPFERPTGPTAWQPPALPLVLAAALRACGGDTDGVVAVVVFLQVFTLIGTGLLVVALARRTTTRVGPAAATAAYLAALVFCQFRVWFQYTHDCWVVLLLLDLLVAGLCWLDPLGGRWRTAAAWGLFGGLCALASPVVGFAWAALSLPAGLRRRRGGPRLALALLVAALAVAPWTVRNYLVFGRLVPLKSNLAYELYQTQCLQEGGLLKAATFRRHPYHPATSEHEEYRALGEAAYLDRKWRQFRQAVRADPMDFLDRAAERFLGATLCYVSVWTSEARQPVTYWLNRLAHPLPFLALLVLVLAGLRGPPLHRAQWAVMGVYVLYLMPYVATSYYERYAAGLLGVKVLLVLWGVDRLLGLLPGRRDEGGLGIRPKER